MSTKIVANRNEETTPPKTAFQEYIACDPVYRDVPDEIGASAAPKTLASNGFDLKSSSPKRRGMIQKRAADMPESCRKTYLRSAEGKASPRTAIKAHCLECVGWVRAEVTLCTAMACPLYAYRPFQQDR